MFPFPIAKPQKCDIQTFYGMDDGSLSTQVWNKPVGVSHVYMLLIGSGGNGDGTNGGGTGAVTVWYGAAQHVPNNLMPIVPNNQNGYNTAVYYNGRSNYQVLLTAQNAFNSVGASAQTPNAFAASGFYRSTAGQNGSSSAVTASSTTFLSGGTNISTADVIANYGYDNTATNAKGYFLMQPIIVGVGASGTGVGGIGCGGGGNGIGGPGMVLIASW